MSHFFAYLAKMKFIQRWGLMRNTYPENIQEHSLQVALIAHGLAVINNRCFNGTINPERTATLALFHDTSEVITGDLATPIKNFNPKIKTAFQEIEIIARQKLVEMLPAELKPAYQDLFFTQPSDESYWALIKAADKISAYLKCVEELKLGNQEFSRAEKTIKADIEQLDMPEVNYFMTHFVPSYLLTLDELN